MKKKAPKPQIEPKKFISLGMGQQSVAMYFMSCLGLLPRVDYAIFSDPRSESKATYDYAKWLVSWCMENNGIPIVFTSAGNLAKDILSGERFASPPLYIRNDDGSEGLLLRQCTREYKIEPVEQAIRQIYGLAPGKRMPKNTEVWMGISLDEIQRMKFARSAWQTSVYPLVGYYATKTQSFKMDVQLKKTRSGCVQWLIDNNFPVPPPSACTFCPYQSDYSWLEIKRKEPEAWLEAVLLDRHVRNLPSLDRPAYLHRSFVPLEEIEFPENQIEMAFNECEEGHCFT